MSPLTIHDDVEAVVGLIEQSKFRYHGDRQLHDGLAFLFKAAGLPIARDVRLSATERVDFTLIGSQGVVGVQVKVKGSTPLVARQLERVAATGTLRALVLVTTGAKHRRLAGVSYPCGNGTTLTVALAKVPRG